MCCLEWLGKLKWRATGWDASLLSFSASRTCSPAESVIQSPSCFADVSGFLRNVQVMQWITTVEVHAKQSVILTDLLRPDILSAF